MRLGASIVVQSLDNDSESTHSYAMYYSIIMNSAYVNYIYMYYIMRDCVLYDNHSAVNLYNKIHDAVLDHNKKLYI